MEQSATYSAVRILLLFAPVMLVAACAFDDANAAGTDGAAVGGVAIGTGDRSASAATQVYQVRALAENTIIVKAMPNATCSVHSNGATGKLALYTDDEGMVSLEITPAAAGSATTFSLECHDVNFANASYGLELRASLDVPILARPTPAGTVRPALTGNPLELTNQQLIARGYPPRPDPKQAPDAHKQWLDAVLQPSTIVNTKLVPMPHRNDFMTMNWAGYVVTSHPKYASTMANWDVPQLTGELNQYDVTSLWVGMGGYSYPGFNGGDMWQGGMEHEVDCTMGFCYARRFPWVELISSKQSNPTSDGTCCGMVTFNNFDITAGDNVLVEMWLGDINGAISKTLSPPLYAWWYISNNTKHIAARGYGGWWFYDSQGHYQAAKDPNSTTPNDGRIPAFITLNGASAEWIVERTQVSKDHLSRLAQFSATHMATAQSWDNDSWRAYGDQSPTQIGMYHQDDDGFAGLPQLARATQLSSSSIQFTHIAHF